MYNSPKTPTNCCLYNTCGWGMFCGAHGVVVSHPLRMRKALGSNPSVSRLLQQRAQLGGMWHMGSGQARPSFLPAMDLPRDPANRCLSEICAGACYVGHMV